MTKGWFIACCSGKSLQTVYMIRHFLLDCLSSSMPLWYKRDSLPLNLLVDCLVMTFYFFFPLPFVSPLRLTKIDTYCRSALFCGASSINEKKVWSLCEPLPGVCKNSRDSSTIVCMNEGLRSLAGWSGRRHQRPFLWYRLPAIMTIILDVSRLREWRAKLS